ncbi:hypothetical protein TNCV_2643531 [Trichonephila clavipes]|nr:hypothetical protein TNCV_2643531 [Trichonephila clavipes]
MAASSSSVIPTPLAHVVTRITVRDSPVWELRKVERRSDFRDVVLRLFCEPSNCFDAPGTDVLLHLREDCSCVLFHRKTFEQTGRSAFKALLLSILGK